MFESTLSRSFEIATNELTYDIFVLEIFYYDIAQDLILNYPKLLATILVLNNLVNIALSSAATVLATEIWPENGELIATVFSTLLLLIFIPPFSFILSMVRPHISFNLHC